MSLVVLDESQFNSLFAELEKMWFDWVISRWDVQYLIKKSEGEYQIKECLLELLPGTKMTSLVTYDIATLQGFTD